MTVDINSLVADFNARREAQSQASYRRYYPSVRTVLIVRLDSGLLDRYTNDQITKDLSVRHWKPLDSSNSFLSAFKNNPLSRNDAEEQARINKYIAENHSAYVASTRDPKGAFTRLLNLKSKFQQRHGGLFGSTALRSNIFGIDPFAAGPINIAGAVARTKPIDKYTVYLDVTPISSSRSVNGFRQADELSLTLDWSKMPFDARAVRAMLALHYEGTVPHSAWESNVPEQNPDDPTPTGFLVPASAPNLRFMGFADSVEDTHDEGGSLVQLKFRDMTSVLLDTQVPPSRIVPLQHNMLLRTAVRNILNMHPSIKAAIQGPVIVQSEDDVEPYLQAALYPKIHTSPEVRRASAQDGTNQPSAAKPPSKVGAASGGETYWDLITDLCISHGYTPVMEFDLLTLVKPRTLFNDVPVNTFGLSEQRFPAPDSLRTRLGITDPVRVLKYGTNLTNVKRDRKLARVRAPSVQVRSLDPHAKVPSKRILIADWPEKPLANKVDASGQNPQEDTITQLIYGVRDQKLLLDIAKQVYESVGRQEMGVSCTTQDLSSWTDHPNFDPNEDPDLLAVHVGDPIRVDTSYLIRSLKVNGFTIEDIQNSELPGAIALQNADPRDLYTDEGVPPVSPDFLRSYLKQYDIDQKTIDVLAEVWNGSTIPEEYRLSAANISFSADSGFSISLDLHEYIRVRADRSNLAPRTVTAGVIESTLKGSNTTADGRQIAPGSEQGKSRAVITDRATTLRRISAQISNQLTSDAPYGRRPAIVIRGTDGRGGRGFNE